MGRAFQRDLMTLAVLGIGGYLIYTKTDWFQQGFSALKEIFGEIGINVGGKGVSGGGGGGTGDLGSTGQCGKTIYTATGKTWTAKDTGKKKVNYASGGSSATTRWQANGVGAVENIELTTYVTAKSGCGDTVSLKAWGPSHSDGNCCWLIVNVDTKSGAFQLDFEGPHPRYNKGVTKGSSMGAIEGKRVGIKMVVWKSGSTIHVEGYGDSGGGWKKHLTWSGSEFGANKKSSSPSSSSEIQFRVDCDGVDIHCATGAEIRPPSSSAYTRLSAGQYSNSLFTHNKPIPVNYYYSRLINAAPACNNMGKNFRGLCYDEKD